MNHLKSLASWLVILSIVVISLSLCPRTSTESLSSPPIPGAAFGPTIDEKVLSLGGDIEKMLGE